MCGTCACGEPAAPPRQVTLQQRVLAHNDQHAAANRQRFRAAGVRVLNLLSSPGSGKTALLERLAQAGAPAEAMAVLVGDLATDLDAQRLRAAGLPAVALTTGQACHLDAAMVERGVAALAEQGVALEGLRWLVIENVGNLVCPAAYDLGESLRVVLFSVTEGEDKPLKYPATFKSAQAILITKMDIAEAVGFDRELAWQNLRQVAPQAQIFEVSARTGQGLTPWYDYLENQR